MPDPASTKQDADLVAIRARAEAATPGPWTAERDRVPGEAWFWTVDGIAGPRISWEFSSVGERAKPDADFIAHAREDIPALLDALEALAAENERLRGIVAMFTKVCDHAATMNFGPGGQCCIACGLMLPPGPILHGDANAGG